MKSKLNSCFKTYDVRGQVNKNIDSKICYEIARSFVEVLKANKVVVGRDARESSPIFAEGVINGIIDQGAEVLDVGLCGTEEVYAATSEFDACGGIEITASHNPIDFNGMKFVKNKSRPLDQEREFKVIRKLFEKGNIPLASSKGSYKNIKTLARKKYVEKILNFVTLSNFPELKVVVNCGNGAAGPTLKKIRSKIEEVTKSITFLELFSEPDPSFPNGIPNPLIPENNDATSEKIRSTKADLGIAFDGDFDRCFFFDENGKLIAGEYIVGILTEVFLEKESKANIVHDPRVIWNTQDIVHRNDGIASLSKTGHAFIKETMRDKNAIYGGEMSAHHYFRDFHFCDSGMIPWLLMLEYLGTKKCRLSELIRKRAEKFPSSGEININSQEPNIIIKKIKDIYSKSAVNISEIDGLSMCFKDWRFNLRQSNTESLLRLNVESRASREVLDKKKLELLNFINLR